jgi:energy-coupling factor transporter transmembrane protein EcfT
MPTHKNFTILKAILLLLISTTVLLTKNWLIISFLLIATIAATLKINSYAAFWQRIKPLLFIAIFIVIFNVAFNFHEHYSIRLISGVIAAGKIIILSLLVFTFTSTTSLKEIIGIFAFLPKKLQLSLTITLNIIPAILEEIQKIKIAQKSRGLNSYSINPKKSIFPIIIPLIHRALERAEHLAILLYSKGVA